jgi:predicted porin
MSRTKKLIAAALALLALAAVPATSVALNGTEGVKVACQGGAGGGCQI